MTTFPPLPAGSLELRAHDLGVTIPPGHPLPDPEQPSGWSIDGRDGLHWLDAEYRANRLMGPRAAATARLRGRP